MQFEVTGGGSEQVWQLFLSDDGKRVHAGTKTSDGGGSVRVRRTTRDRTGTDRIKMSAVNLATGESCLTSPSS